MVHDNVNHPQHYTEGFDARPVECIDITRHLSFAAGNAIKYVWRAGKKGDKTKALEDLEKALWYIGCMEEEALPRPSSGFRAACAVFDLIKDDGSHRYLAVKCILFGVTTAARDNVMVMRRELQEGI